MRIVVLWLAGLLIFALLSGVAGITLANSGINRAYHDTYYVVAHFYYALNFVILFAVFAAIYFAVHKWTNRTVPLWAGGLQFALMIIGTAMTFFPQHFLGRSGMPRRYIDYPDAFALWNKVATVGVWLNALSLLVFLFIVIYLIFWGRPKPIEPQVFK